MSSAQIPLGILQRIAEFLADLPEDQLSDLADGRARVAYVPVGSEAPAPRTAPSQRRPRTAAPAPKPETVELIRDLEALGSREQAAKHVASVKGPLLRDLGKALGIPGISAIKADALRAEIVEATVGRRLDSIAIRGFEGDRP